MTKQSESQAVSLPRYLIRTLIPATAGAAALAAILLYSNGIRAGDSGFWTGVVSMGFSGAALGLLIGLLNYRRFVYPMKGTGEVASAVRHVSQDIEAISRQSEDMHGRMERMSGRVFASFDETENLAAVVEQLLASTEGIQSVMDNLHETAAALASRIREFKA